MWRSVSQRAPASHYDARSSPTTLGYHHSPSSSTAATCPEPPIRLRHNSPHRLKTTGGYQQPPANYIETGHPASAYVAPPQGNWRSTAALTSGDGVIPASAVRCAHEDGVQDRGHPLQRPTGRDGGHQDDLGVPTLRQEMRARPVPRRRCPPECEARRHGLRARATYTLSA